MDFCTLEAIISGTVQATCQITNRKLHTVNQMVLSAGDYASRNVQSPLELVEFGKLQMQTNVAAMMTA